MNRHKFDLAALKAKALPRCSFADFCAARSLRIEIAPGADPAVAAQSRADLEAAMDGYLLAFVRPEKPQKCIGCGGHLGGGSFAVNAVLSTFEWGLVHGEGFCRDCGYPARAYHQTPVLNAALILQYHPDELQERRPAEARSEP